MMKHRYYSLPLRLDEVIQGKNLEQCSLDDSIVQNIHLLMTTAFGEIEFDQGFGCIIWETDFDNLTAVNRLRDQVKQSILSVLQQYEKRLEKIRVEVTIRQEELPAKINGRHVKKRIIVQVNGLIRSTHQPFNFIDSFFAGPLSYQ